jgi:hypothetical protein
MSSKNYICRQLTTWWYFKRLWIRKHLSAFVIRALIKWSFFLINLIRFLLLFFALLLLLLLLPLLLIPAAAASIATITTCQALFIFQSYTVALIECG